MFVAEVKIRNAWEKLEGVTFDSEVTYFIVNNSTDTIFAAEGSEAPADTLKGIPVFPGNYIKYEKGSQNLYMRNRKQSTTDLYSTVYISKKDEEDVTPAPVDTDSDSDIDSDSDNDVEQNEVL